MSIICMLGILEFSVLSRWRIDKMDVDLKNAQKQWTFYKNENSDVDATTTLSDSELLIE